MALVGRLLEAQGFRVGIIAQPDWRDVEAFRALGRPTVMWGVTAGNMDSMVNRYTSDRRLRHDDAYSPGGAGGRRPGSRADRLRAALPRGVRRRARRRRRHRGEPAPDRALRLLVEQGAAVDPDRFARRSARLRQRRARRRRDRAPAGGGRGARAASPTCAGPRSRARPGRATAGPRSIRRRSTRPGRSRRPSIPTRRPSRRRRPDAACAPARVAGAGAADVRAARQPATARRPRALGRAHARLRRRRRPIRCCTRTRRASCTSRRTRGTRARWSSGTARATSG